MFLSPAFRPALDPGFQPASLWNRAYRALVAERGGGIPWLYPWNVAMAQSPSFAPPSCRMIAGRPKSTGATWNAC
jgi:hypothetical protein